MPWRLPGGPATVDNIHDLSRCLSTVSKCNLDVLDPRRRSKEMDDVCKSSRAH